MFSSSIYLLCRLFNSRRKNFSSWVQHGTWMNHRPFQSLGGIHYVHFRRWISDILFLLIYFALHAYISENIQKIIQIAFYGMKNWIRLFSFFTITMHQICHSLFNTHTHTYIWMDIIMLPHNAPYAKIPTYLPEANQNITWISNIR